LIWHGKGISIIGKRSSIAAKYNLRFALEEVIVEFEIPISGLDRTTLMTGLSGNVG
jgi:hypothetical protein